MTADRTRKAARAARYGDRMPIDPRLQPILDAAAAAPPPDPSLSIAQKRAAAHAAMEMGFLAFSEPGPDPAATTDHRIAVDGGEITVRVYTPHGVGPFPAHVYFHGGGFWLGELDHSDSSCRAISAGAGCVVASVDYRLAPEHAFPTGAEDCYTALQWVVDHAGELDVDASRVSIGGGSAGGNLTAVVALMARDRGGPRLVFQLLEIPVTDLTLSQPSIDENGAGFLLTKDAIRQYTDYYLGETGDAKHPYASPLFADDLGGLPPALVMTAEFDPLRDEGEAYGRRLQEAGVPTTIRRWEGQFHGSQNFATVIPEAAAEYRDQVNAALRAAYGA
jgi:acetyl esterase